MRIEIINTGSELMLGRTLNTHQQWLCAQLADRGYLVQRQLTVADTAEAITAAVRESLQRAELVVTTGGLGPTSDDLTREALAGMLGLPLREDATVVAHIEARFASRRRPVPPGSRVQALVPEGALVLQNAHGTAPGLVVTLTRNPCAPHAASLVLLPGPPRELQPMFLDQVLPWMDRSFPRPEPFVCRTLRSTGIGESVVQARIAGPLERHVQSGLDIGYCARPGEVDIRLSARGAAAATLVEDALGIVRARVGNHVFGAGEETLEQVVVRLLTARQHRLVVAESCTGGRLSSRITDVPGASLVFLGGLITYSNELKQSLLGVSAKTLQDHGAVSEATAREMAEGARTRHDADYALAITGIAGPTGGTETKPVGTAYLALATRHETRVRAQLNAFDRETFKHVTSQQALEMLRQRLIA